MTELAADAARQTFETIAAALMEEHPDVALGKMMSSPGITVRGKVFAFFDRGAMVFRLGKGVDPVSFGITSYRPLNPFKTSRRWLAGIPSPQPSSRTGNAWRGLR